MYTRVIVHLQKTMLRIILIFGLFKKFYFVFMDI